MAKNRLYRLEGVILDRRNQGEADRVIRLLTQERLVDLLAKGARKPRSRKAGHLELFSRTAVLVSRVSDSWDIISQAEALTQPRLLREDFTRATFARYLAELVLRFFTEETPPALYTLMQTLLTQMEDDPQPERLARWGEQRILTLAGFRPEWHTCVGERESHQCGAQLHPRPTDSRPYGLAPELGGALCPYCLAVARSNGTQVRPLSPSALSWLQTLQSRPLEDIRRFSLTERTAQTLAKAMEFYVSYHLERRPAALRTWPGIRREKVERGETC